MAEEFPCIESRFTLTLKRPTSNWVIRVWRNEEELRDAYDNEDVRNVCYRGNWTNKPDLIRAICKLGRINAVEITNEFLNDGIVVYTVWP